MPHYGLKRLQTVSQNKSLIYVVSVRYFVPTTRKMTKTLPDYHLIYHRWIVKMMGEHESSVSWSPFRATAV